MPSSRSKTSSQISSQTAELFRLYCKHKTVELRNQIAELNDRLAIRIAQRHQASCSLDLEDLIQLSRIGLISAIKRFDPDKGAAFSSFAVPYCRGEIQHFLRDHKSLVKSPRRWQESSDSVRAIQRFAIQLGREISLDEAAILGLGFDWQKWKNIEQATQSQSIKVIDDEVLQVADQNSTNIEEEEEFEAIKLAIQKQLNKLPKTTLNCILERYWSKLEYETIGKRHGMSAGKVKSLIEEGLSQLREVVLC